jgi:hypothetical protein
VDPNDGADRDDGRRAGKETTLSRPRRLQCGGGLFSCVRPKKKRRAQTAVRRPEARCSTPGAKVGFPESSLFSRNNPQAVVSLVYQPRMKGTKMARFLPLTQAPGTSVVSSPDVESALTFRLIWPLISSPRRCLRNGARRSGRVFQSSSASKAPRTFSSLTWQIALRVACWKTRNTTGSWGRNQDSSTPRFPCWLSQSGEPFPRVCPLLNCKGLISLGASCSWCIVRSW